MTTYTAAIATASDVVAGDYCDVTVAENEIVTHKETEDGTETPVYGMSDTIVMPSIDTDVRTDDEDSLAKAELAAADILESNGWTVTGTWEVAANALYAPVERA
jgi:hypothetical protein